VEGEGLVVVFTEVLGCCILKAYVAGRRSGFLDRTFSGGGSCKCVCVRKLGIVRSPSCSRYRPTFLQPRIVHIQEEDSRAGCSALFTSCRIHE
jgi:hypothetical protein